MTEVDSKRVLRYFALVQLLYFSSTALWSYCNVYFRELGFSGQEIGLMSSAGTALALVGLPVLGVVSDRLRSPKTVFFALLLLMYPLYLLVPVAGTVLGKAPVVFTVLIALLISSGQINVAMIDSWNGDALERLNLSYGSVRRYGSLGYIAMVVLSSVIVGPVLPAWSCCILMPLLGIPLIVLILRKQPWERTFCEKQETGVSTAGLLSLVLKNYYFLTYLLFIVGYYAFVSIVDLDVSYLMDYIGVRQSSLGIVYAVRAAMEILGMVLLGRMKKLPPLWFLLTVAGMLSASENLLYGAVNGMAGMLAVTLLSGMGGGIFYGISANYVLRIVDRRAASTAMSVIGMVRALVSIVGMSLGGAVIDHYGVITLTTAVGLLLLTLSLVFAGTCVLGRRVLKLPYVTEKEKTE